MLMEMPKKTIGYKWTGVKRLINIVTLSENFQKWWNVNSDDRYANSLEHFYNNIRLAEEVTLRLYSLAPIAVVTYSPSFYDY